MILKNFRPYSYKLKSPLRVRETIIESTDGYSFDIEYQGEKYRGDLPCFKLFYPHYRPNALEDTSIEIDINRFEKHELLFGLADAKGLTVNEIFALEQFLLEILIKNKFLEFNSSPVYMNDLYYEGLSLVKSKCIKLKVGRDIGNENRILKELSKEDTVIRLDANKMLCPHSTESLLDGVDTTKIEYIEEPFETIEQWCNSRFFNKIPLALDESFDYTDPDKWRDMAEHLIAKPSVNIPPSQVLKLLDQGSFNIIISSAFEVGISFNTLLLLSAQSTQKFHGLSPINLIEHPHHFSCGDKMLQALPQEKI